MPLAKELAAITSAIQERQQYQHFIHMKEKLTCVLREKAETGNRQFYIAAADANELLLEWLTSEGFGWCWEPDYDVGKNYYKITW